MFGHFLSLAASLMLLTLRRLQGETASMLLLWQPDVLLADLLNERESFSKSASISK